jgi:hypothetical protein
MFFREDKRQRQYASGYYTVATGLLICPDTEATRRYTSVAFMGSGTEKTGVKLFRTENQGSEGGEGGWEGAVGMGVGPWGQGVTAT